MEEKSEKRSVSFPKALLQQAEAKAGNNLSGYIQGLISADMSAPRAVGALAADVLVQLTHDFCGKPSARKMAERLGAKNQADELQAILTNYLNGPHLNAAALEELKEFIRQIALAHLGEVKKSLPPTGKIKRTDRLKQHLAARDASV